MESIVEITGLRYALSRAETTEVLCGIDREISKGEFLAIAGGQVQAKSTLCYS